MNRLCLTVLAICMFWMMAPPVPAIAAEPVIQAEWAEAKREVSLPNGQRLAWVEMGPPGGTPLILLHGWTDSSRAWSLAAPHLAQNRRVYLVDMRGHGASAKPDCCYALADFAQDIALFMEVQGMEQADVAGHSLGGMVAQRLAADHPERVSNMVLVATMVLPPLRPGDDFWQAIRGLPDRLEPGTNAFYDGWLTQVEAAPDPEFRRFARAETLSVPATVWRQMGRELTSGTSGFAPDVRAPVLILSSSRDEFFGAEHRLALSQAYPEARHLELGDGGHNLVFEAPERVAAEIESFLD